MKGQVTLEYIGSLMLFLLVLLGAVTMNMSNLPQFYEQTETSHKYLDAKSISDALLTMEDDPGLASSNTESNYLSIETGEISSVSYDDLNSTFNPEYTYYFNFTKYEIVETPKSYIRGNAPAGWNEPDYCPNPRNEVHHDNNGDYAVVACGGRYDTVYDGNGGNFGSSTLGFVDASDIQNRENEPGASFIITQDLGKISDVDVNTLENIGERVKLNRYAFTDGGNLVKIEVIAW